MSQSPTGQCAGWRLVGCVLLGALAVAPLFLAGCAEQEPIEIYTVQKTPRDLMLGAIVPRGEKTWYFKLTGPKPAVEQHQAAFHKFIESLQFAKEGPEDKPAWQLPDGWQEVKEADAASAMFKPYATIKLPATEAKLELTVTPLPKMAGTPEEEILANVNRWRGQMGLAIVGPVNLYSTENQDEVTKTVDINGSKVTLVSLVGRAKPARKSPPFASGGPFAGGGRMTPPNDDVHAGVSSDAAPAARSSRLDFAVPEGWQPGRPSSISEAAFIVRDGDKSIEITVTRLPVSDFLANVSRWRGQVQLDPIDEAELTKIKKAVPVGPVSGEYVELVGTGAQGRPDAIYGAMAVDDAQAWFFKLRGDADLAARERERFAAFLKSVSFKK